MVSKMISLQDVQAARERIDKYVKRTPTVRSRTLSEMLAANVYLKLEVFQTTGAFKIRGAFNKILCELDHARGSGVVAVSGGNHAQAVAYAGSVLGCRTLILTHRGTPRNYLDATRGYGAEVVLLADISEAFMKAREYEQQGMLFVHPFDDPLVMAGQGTLGLEILEDVPDVTDVFVSIGGGGLLSGTAVAIRSQKNVRFRGVETEGFAQHRSRRRLEPLRFLRRHWLLPGSTSSALRLCLIKRLWMHWSSCWNAQRSSLSPLPPAHLRLRCDSRKLSALTPTLCSSCVEETLAWRTSATIMQNL